MATVKPKTSVRAAGVSRTLSAAGLTRGESMASGMVRGWHTYYAGFVVEQDYERHSERRTRTTYSRGQRAEVPYLHTVRTPLDKAFVTYQHGDNARYLPEEERDRRAAKVLDQAQEILVAKGYTVERHPGSLTVTPGA